MMEASHVSYVSVGVPKNVHAHRDGNQETERTRVPTSPKSPDACVGFTEAVKIQPFPYYCR